MPRAALRIQDKINKGWRKETRKLGQRWNVERNGAVVVANYDAIVTRDEAVNLIEMDTDSFSYRLRGARDKLQIGDYIVGVDAASKRGSGNIGERYLLVSTRLHRDNVVVRADQTVKVYRNEQIQQAGDVASSYAMISPLTDKVLARNLTTHQYEFRDQSSLSGWTTQIWAGITFGRAGEYPVGYHVPLDTSTIGWVITMALTPGVVLRAGDIVVDDLSGNWHRIDRAYMQTNSAYLYQLRTTRVRM